MGRVSTLKPDGRWEHMEAGTEYLPVPQRICMTPSKREQPSDIESSDTADSIPLLQTTCEEPKDSTSQTDSTASQEMDRLDLPYWINYSNEYREEALRRSLQKTSTHQGMPEKPSDTRSLDTSASIPLLQRIKRLFWKG